MVTKAFLASSNFASSKIIHKIDPKAINIKQVNLGKNLSIWKIKVAAFSLYLESSQGKPSVRNKRSSPNRVHHGEHIRAHILGKKRIHHRGSLDSNFEST